MTARVCSTPGCPALVRQGTRGGRCTTHARDADQARGTRTDRGYGPDHEQLRRDWQRSMDRGETVECHNPTCLTPDQPIDPTNWHLGHDAQRHYRGPEHPRCNLSEAGRSASR